MLMLMHGLVLHMQKCASLLPVLVLKAFCSPADGAESELQGLSAGGADSGAAEGGSSVPGGLSSGRPRGHGGDAR